MWQRNLKPTAGIICRDLLFQSWVPKVPKWRDELCANLLKYIKVFQILEVFLKKKKTISVSHSNSKKHAHYQHNHVLTWRGIFEVALLFIRLNMYRDIELYHLRHSSVEFSYVMLYSHFVGSLWLFSVEADSYQNHPWAVSNEFFHYHWHHRNGTTSVFNWFWGGEIINTEACFQSQ